MKRKIIFTALAFVLIFTGFIYLKPNSDALHNSTQVTPPAPQSNSFLFGSMDSWQDAGDNYADYDLLIGLEICDCRFRIDLCIK